MSIKPLAQQVINQIAAGEVIQRPSNAIKELIENSIDAHSTQIRVVIQQGGFKLIQFQDNGDGIGREDMPLVCQRFATSKLKEFEDLRTIQSFGFRGEALASISHIAQVAITSRVKGAPCAYQVSYRDGKMIGEPKPCAGTVGTIIRIVDLFYNLKTRKQAMKNISEQYNAIVDVLAKYALHYSTSGIAFTCKKHQEASSDLLTSAQSTFTEALGRIYNQEVAREVLPFSTCNQPESEKTGTEPIQFEANGYISNANYNLKKRRGYIFFINNRLVEIPILKRALDDVYSQYLPKHTYPFVYLSLTLPPETIDVNVHPTKQQVQFLYQEQIVEGICAALQDKLQNANQSRTFYSQLRLPQEYVNAPNTPSVPEDEEATLLSKKAPTRQAPNRMVRTDYKASQMEEFFSPSTTPSSSTPAKAPRHKLVNPEKESQRSIERENKRPKYSSLNELLESIKGNSRGFAVAFFKECQYVGIVDKTFCLLQYQTKLFLVNYPHILQHYFYQQTLQRFRQHGHSCIKLRTELPLAELLSIGMKQQQDQVQDMCNFLVSKREMLEEYFGIGIDSDAKLLTLPQLIGGEDGNPTCYYAPSFRYLPEFLVRLCQQVNWTHEKDCFRMVAMALGWWYGQVEENGNNGNTELKRQWLLQYEFLPALRLSSFYPQQCFSDNHWIVEVACLKNLYKVFERC